jgi:Tfp pilus assembly protein PilN
MFNLLPEKDKKKLWREYTFRRVIVSLFFIAVIGLVILIFAAPSLILSISKQNEVIRRIDALKQSTLFNESDSLNRKLTTESLKIRALKPSNSSVTVAELVKTVIARKGEGIRIKNISYSRNPDGQSSINLSGVAQDREKLLEFTQSLESEGWFEKADLPVSSFAKDQDLDFSILIKGNF